MDQFFNLSRETIGMLMQKNALMSALILLRAVTQYLKMLDNETHTIDQLKLRKYIYFCIPCEELVQLILHNNFMQGNVTTSDTP